MTPSFFFQWVVTCDDAVVGGFPNEALAVAYRDLMKRSWPTKAEWVVYWQANQ